MLRQLTAWRQLGGGWGPNHAPRLLRPSPASMWAVLALFLAVLARPAAATSFETATVDGVFNITSEWEGGFCGSLM